MDAALKRPWYRLHWGTVLVVLFVGVGWVGLSFPSTIDKVFPTIAWYELEGAGEWEYLEGWPMLCIQADAKGTETDAAALAIDLALAIASLAAVAFVAERLERRGMRFRISTMLTVVAVLAILCAFWRWDSPQQLADPGRFQSVGMYVSIQIAGWNTIVPVLFALGCLVYVLLQFTQTAAVRSFACFHRPPGSKVEADGSPAQ